jgi:hypothetical protein
MRRKPSSGTAKVPRHANFILAIAENASALHRAKPDPYMHIFHRHAGGGNILAFFELPTKQPDDRPVGPQHPRRGRSTWRWKVGSVEDHARRQGARWKPTVSK